MIKLVVFDWNGTLFADAQAVLSSFNEQLVALGYSPSTPKQLREAYTMPVSKIYEGLGADPQLIQDRATEMVPAFHTAYESRAARIRTRQGTRHILHAMHERGITNVIFSNHTVEGITYQLQRLKLISYFDVILANEDIMASHHKGKKDRLADYLKGAHLKPEEILIIGDTVEEIHIGQELGLKTVAITGGFCSTKRLKAAKPDVLIHKLHDLINVIEEAK